MYVFFTRGRQPTVLMLKTKPNQTKPTRIGCNETAQYNDSCYISIRISLSNHVAADLINKTNTRTVALTCRHIIFFKLVHFSRGRNLLVKIPSDIYECSIIHIEISEKFVSFIPKKRVTFLFNSTRLLQSVINSKISFMTFFFYLWTC